MTNLIDWIVSGTVKDTSFPPYPEDGVQYVAADAHDLHAYTWA